MVQMAILTSEWICVGREGCEEYAQGPPPRTIDVSARTRINPKPPKPSVPPADGCEFYSSHLDYSYRFCVGRDADGVPLPHQFQTAACACALEFVVVEDTEPYPIGALGHIRHVMETTRRGKHVDVLSCGG